MSVKVLKNTGRASTETLTIATYTSEKSYRLRQVEIILKITVKEEWHRSPEEMDLVFI